MILESEIEQVVIQQKDRILKREIGLTRELISEMQILSSHVLIISGIRRCGKSTLLTQMMKKLNSDLTFFINFESPQLYDFTINDFVRLNNLIVKSGSKTLFFDEIQIIDGWELFVREKIDEGYQIVVTGSNSSMLSSELGTKLTGRHITRELFPFSYSEFLSYKELLPCIDSLKIYLQTGGFPEFVKSSFDEQLSTLFEDVIIRDIVARYGIKDIKSIHRLAMYLMSNISNKVSATKLKQPLSIGSTSTILNWFAYLEQSYLIAFLPMYSHSAKVQLINPRKIYAIDLGLVGAITSTLTQDIGRKLENLIFLHLRRYYKEIYYFDDNGECDFVVIKKGLVIHLIQVCYQLNSDNLNREVNGLIKAMKFFNHQKAIIVTYNNTETIKREGFEIEVIPAYKYLMLKE